MRVNCCGGIRRTGKPSYGQVGRKIAGRKMVGQKDFWGDGVMKLLMNIHETLIEITAASTLNNSMRRSEIRPLSDRPPSGEGSYGRVGGTPRGFAMGVGTDQAGDHQIIIRRG